jgi:holo-[acyl-carrier protein] synthase
MENVIIDVGLDIVEIERIKKVCEKYKRFKERIYSLRELEQLSGKKDLYPSLAARFAAKEAFIKAIGGKYSGWNWKDVEILYGINGKPEINLRNKALEFALQKGVKDIKVSISHTHKYAVAVVVITIKGDR